ncbi:MAG: membrane dipeptidase, partial [Eubacteriales bacterium]|nr:membrane dipeptidase [Eubacteriales bacterium]
MVRIADAHSDFAPFKILNESKGRLFDHADLTRMERGGVALQIFAVWVPPECPDQIKCGRREIDYLLSFADNDLIRLCTGASDMAHDAPVKAVIAIESGESIGCDVGRIQQVYGLGARFL